MKIVLATYGTTGDVQPFLALGVELLRRGHKVVLAAPPNFAPRAAQHGLAFRGLGQAADNLESRQVFASAYEMEGIVEQVRSTLSVPMKHAEASVRDLMETAGDADLLISIPYQTAGQITAELLGLPFVSVHFSPFGNSRRPRLSAAAAPSFNALRATFGLPPIAEPLGVDGISPLLALTPVSPNIFPRPAAWPPHHHLTGFWFLDEPSSPDPALQAFLEAGEAPVVIGFGSISHRDPEAITRILVRAVESAGVRAVIQAGWSGLAVENPPPEVMFTSFVPHNWLFPRASCVVHGGGAGTTASVLRAGVPTVFVPHWLDQFLWGALARERHLASASIPMKELTAAGLAAAIRTARESPRIRDRCTEVSRAIQAENGVAVAAGLIEALTGRTGAVGRGTAP
jgi:sterol 3beta-glucosyltransferase